MKCYGLDGRLFDLYDPDRYDIEEIAHGLSMTCRFRGCCRHFFSVAQHSVNVAVACADYDESCMLAGLLHDAAEAYIGDIPSPVKDGHLFQTDDGIWRISEIEDRLLGNILSQHGLDSKLPSVVKAIDILEGHKEMHGLILGPVFLSKYDCMPPERAFETFMNLYKELTK